MSPLARRLHMALPRRKRMKDSTKDQVGGKVHEVKGKVKEKAGKADERP